MNLFSIRFDRCAARLLGLLVAALISLPGFAQVQVGFEVPSINVTEGASERIAVTVNSMQAPGLAAFQVVLDYDPAVISIIDPNAGSAGLADSFAPLGADPDCTTVRAESPCPDPTWALTDTGRVAIGTTSIEPVAGQVVIAYGTHGANAPSLADGAIAVIELVGVSAGATSITLTGVVVAGNQEPPQPYPSVSSNLSVNVDASALDTDGDGFPDGSDNCPFASNSSQQDSGGLATAIPNGIGDACECGDVSNNGIVDNTDAVLIKRYVLGLPPGVDPDKCNINAGSSCDNTDAVLIQRAVLGLPPGLTQSCVLAGAGP